MTASIDFATALTFEIAEPRLVLTALTALTGFLRTHTYLPGSNQKASCEKGMFL